MGLNQLDTPLRAIVFDLDGTLYVSNELGREIALSAYRYMASLKGISSKQAEALIRETKGRLSAASGFETPLSLACMELGGDIRELHRRFAAEIAPEPLLKRDERVVELISILSTRFELYLYTNNNRTLSGRIMDAIGVAGLYRRVFTIEDFWRPKPDTEALETVYGEIGRKPAECLFVGDRYDIDLRLPAVAGSAIFLAKSVEELLPLAKIMDERNL